MSEIESIRGDNQIGCNVWELLLPDGGEQHKEDCHHRDETVCGIVAMSRRDHMRNYSPHITACIDRRGYASWPPSFGGY